MLKILREKTLRVLGDQIQGMTVTGLSNALNVSRQFLNKLLAELYAEKLIRVRKVGVAKLIYLNRDFDIKKLSTKNLIELDVLRVE